MSQIDQMAGDYIFSNDEGKLVYQFDSFLMSLVRPSVDELLHAVPLSK